MKNKRNMTFLLHTPSNLAELDTTILRYNREYPNVGFPISQATEFDHRLGEVVAESKTNSDGSFKIENIRPGGDNIVALKKDLIGNTSTISHSLKLG